MTWRLQKPIWQRERKPLVSLQVRQVRSMLHVLPLPHSAHRNLKHLKPKDTTPVYFRCPREAYEIPTDENCSIGSQSGSRRQGNSAFSVSRCDLIVAKRKLQIPIEKRLVTIPNLSMQAVALDDEDRLDKLQLAEDLDTTAADLSSVQHLLILTDL